MTKMDLRDAIRLVLALSALITASAFAQQHCVGGDTECHYHDFPPGDYDGNDGSAPPGSVWYVTKFISEAPGTNPYPANCGSSREQRLQHARYDIASAEAAVAQKSDIYDAYVITYDDGLRQWYINDMSQYPDIAPVAGVDLVLLGGKANVPNSPYELDGCYVTTIP